MTAPAGARGTASRAKAAGQTETDEQAEAIEQAKAAGPTRTAEATTASPKTGERKSASSKAAERKTGDRRTGDRATRATTEPGKTSARPGTATRSRTAGAERAYARRDQRRDRSIRQVPERRPAKQRQTLERPRPQLAVKPKAKQLQAKMAVSRVPFVVAVMGVLATGLVTTLWLSIATVSGSYQLEQGRSEINALNEKHEQLMRQNNYLSSPPAMQRRAAEWGWVPVEDPPHLTKNPDGSPRVVGEPKVAQPRPPAPAPPAPADAPDLAHPQGPQPQQPQPQPQPQAQAQAQQQAQQRAQPQPLAEGR